MSSTPSTQNNQQTPITRNSSDDNKFKDYLEQLPEDLISIKENIQNDQNNDSEPLMVTIRLRKKKRKLFLPVKLRKLTIDALDENDRVDDKRPYAYEQAQQ